MTCSASSEASLCCDETKNKHSQSIHTEAKETGLGSPQQRDTLQEAQKINTNRNLSVS